MLRPRIAGTRMTDPPSRLQARLLEFLKFRALAAQEALFADLVAADGAGPDPALFRSSLAPLWPEALPLADEELLATLETARRLSVS